MPREHTVVTAADHRFHRTLCQMLLSVERRRLHEAHHTIAFDLGLTDRDRRLLARRFPWCELRAFPFDAHPPHVRDLSLFAWKPAAIGRVVDERGGLVLWLDSAAIVHESIAPVFDRIRTYGVVSLAGRTPLGGCCDARTLARLAVDERDLARPYRAGGVLGFDAGRPAIRALVAEWRARALEADCIAPPGHDRRVHRFDQALVTALLYRAERDSGLVLGDEEIDISSANPARWISTRNKVPAWMPLAWDPLVRSYYATYKAADRAVLRVRGRRPA